MQEFVDEENGNADPDLPKQSPHFLSKTTEIEMHSLKRHQTHRETNIDLDSKLKQKEVRSAQEKPSSHLFDD